MLLPKCRVYILLYTYMGIYSDYNIIPIGDHCVIAIILKELGLRKQSYPFDWITNKEQLYDTNIMHNIQIIDELATSDNVNTIVRKYIGNAFTNNNINSVNNIWFPHDTERIPDIFEKYKRRFIRLKQDLCKKNVFIIVTRYYYIPQDTFRHILERLLIYNSNSIILFISGINHTYFENGKYANVTFKYIEYDISQFYDYDYSTFRPNVKKFLSNFLL